VLCHDLFFFAVRFFLKKTNNNMENKNKNEICYENLRVTKQAAADCIKFVKDTIKGGFDQFDVIIDPCARDGAFVNQLNTDKTVVWYDIEAKEEAHKVDFLKYGLTPAMCMTKNLFIGFPPFGINCLKSISFFNHAARVANVIAFVVPVYFRKPTFQDDLDKSFHMVNEFAMTTSSLTYHGEPFNLRCMFQVWVREFVELQPHLKKPSGIRNYSIWAMQAPDFYFVNGDDRDKADIAIKRVGLDTGTITTELEDIRSMDTYLFLKLNDPKDFDRVYDNLTMLNLQTLGQRYDAKQIPSIGKRDICGLYIKLLEDQKAK
jgi:hypothetical protein